MENISLMAFLDPQLLLLMAVGMLIGIGFGCIPGLNTPMALALVLPITFGMEFVTAIAMLVAVYIGGLSGGLISAILLNMPGTAAAISTTFDGFPMAQKGEAMRALTLGIVSSFLGGLFATIVLMFATSRLAAFALGFGPLEYLGVAVFALCLITLLIKGDVINGFITTCFGILLSTIGSDPVDGVSRFTFGFFRLDSGVHIVLVIIGMFALATVLQTTLKSLDSVDSVEQELDGKVFFKTLKEFKGQIWNVLRSASIGTVFGILPGLGGSASSLVAYAQAKRLDKDPDSFGEGNPSGIVAPESANNAVAGGALIPMLALGVPGSSPVALIMSAFMIHGVTIGPLLITERPDILQAIFVALMISNVLMLVLQSVLLKYFAKIITIEKYILLPIMIVFCGIGAFITNNSVFNISVLLILAVVGFLMSNNDFPLTTIIMGYVLGSLVELYYRRTMIYYGSLGEAFAQPSMGMAFLVVALVVLVLSIGSRVRAYRQERA